MATGRLLPGLGDIIETQNAGYLLPGLGDVVETEVAASTVFVPLISAGSGPGMQLAAGRGLAG